MAAFLSFQYDNIIEKSLPHCNGFNIPYYGIGYRKLAAWMDQYVPHWVHPNFISFLALLGALVPMAFVLKQHLANPEQPVPPIHQLLLALGFLIYETFDELDGAHARATGKCSRFGAFLDDAIDCWGFSLSLFAHIFLAVWAPLQPQHSIYIFFTFSLGAFDCTHNYYYPRTASTNDDIALMRHLICLNHVFVYFMGSPLWLEWLFFGMVLLFGSLYVFSIAQMVYKFGICWGTFCYLSNHVAAMVFVYWYLLQEDTLLQDRYYVVIALTHAIYVLQFIMLVAAFLDSPFVYGFFETVWPGAVCALVLQIGPLHTMQLSLAVTLSVVMYCSINIISAENRAKAKKK